MRVNRPGVCFFRAVRHAAEMIGACGSDGWGGQDRCIAREGGGLRAFRGAAEHAMAIPLSKALCGAGMKRQRFEKQRRAAQSQALLQRRLLGLQMPQLRASLVPPKTMCRSMAVQPDPQVILVCVSENSAASGRTGS